MGIGANFFCSFCRPIDGVTQQLGVKWRRQSIHVFFSCKNRPMHVKTNRTIDEINNKTKTTSTTTATTATTTKTKNTNNDKNKGKKTKTTTHKKQLEQMSKKLKKMKQGTWEEQQNN
jgi:formate dehydrogenase assembly factor FdhD